MDLPRTLLSLVLLLTLGLASAQNNSTCTDCNKRGICTNNVCSCFGGFFGENCEITVEDEHPTAWPVIRIIIGLVFLFFFLIAGLIIISLYRRVDYAKSLQMRIARWAMISYAVYDGITGFIYLVDPHGVILPYPIIAIYTGYGCVTAFIFLGLILFHWVEVFHVATAAINKAEMMAKVNANYEPNVTVEEIQGKVLKMSKFKTFFLSIVALQVIINLGYIITVSLYLSISSILIVISLIFLNLMYIGFGFGFVIYGRRLMKLMPESVRGEVKSITWKVTTFCVVSLIFTLYSFLIDFIVPPTPTSLIVKAVIVSAEQWPLHVMIFSIYANFNLSKRGFFVRKYLWTSGTSGNDRKKSSKRSESTI